MSDKMYYSIAEVSDMTSLPQSTLRFWEQEFDDLKPRKGMNDHRTYTLEDIELVQMIKHLVKEDGYTLDGARSQLKKLGRDELKRKIGAIENLLKLRKMLVELKARL